MTTPRSADAVAVVHLLVGLNGAGKSTVARSIAARDGAVRLSLDASMRQLHPELAHDDPAYGPIAERCRELLWRLAREHLDRGVDVVLDWNQWSRARRAHWRDAALSAGHVPVLHHVTTGVERSVERARDRAAHGDPESHPLDEAELRRFATILEPPHEAAAEGMAVVVHP